MPEKSAWEKLLEEKSEMTDAEIEAEKKKMDGGKFGEIRKQDNEQAEEDAKKDPKRQGEADPNLKQQ